MKLLGPLMLQLWSYHWEQWLQWQHRGLALQKTLDKFGQAWIDPAVLNVCQNCFADCLGLCRHECCHIDSRSNRF